MTQDEILRAAGFNDYFDYTRSKRNYSPYRWDKWRLRYSDLIDDVFGLAGKKVLDIGCAGGSNVKAFWIKGADVYGCDINTKCIRRTPFKSIKSRLQAIDTNRLSEFYAANQFDLIHSQQVFEHFPDKAYSEQVVNEIAKILKPGGVVYVGLVTGEHLMPKELLGIYKRGEDVDITHANIWPMEYWHKLFEKAGLVNVDTEFQPKFEGNKMYHKYKWHQMFYRKANNGGVIKTQS
ncbi:MAG: class I SAM-dependent methyltransferase [Candidatus Ranarchaeia archaeon]